ncbi:MAG: hypothetical protein K6C94_01935 [Candidatus Gastranaerophilales bacterium]|nr:hypothetical protein [Candidatus Gastranaerophilales bacterium]
MNITNNIKENSKINIENSQIHAKEKLNIDVLTESSFKQQTSAKASGFIANPKNANTLNIENNNTLNISANSKLFSGSKVDINLDSNNTLVAHANAKSEHFGFKDPQSESYLSMTINNEINNSGTIEAGDLVDIDFMLNSDNNLTQYAHTESQAAIPTTTEKGKLSQTVKNTFKINSGASVISGNDININYSEGKNRLSSEISYVSVCWAAFGIPITSKGKQSNTTKSRQSSLVLDGTMTAGKGNDKYMKINRDGSVDTSTVGFYDSEYTLKNDGIIDKEAMKNNNIASITIDLQNTNANIIEVTETITNIDEKINNLQETYNSNQEVIDYINELQNNNYSFKTTQDVNTIIKNNLKTAITSAGISETTFDTIFSQYSAAISQIEAHNTEVYESGSGEYLAVPTISDFLNTHDFGLTSAQKTTVINSMNAENALIKTSDVGNFTIYNNKYILTNEIVTKDNKNIGIEFSNIIDNQKTISEEIESNTTTKNAQIQLKADLLAKKETLNENLTKAQNDTIEDDTNKEYAIVFNSINPSSSKVQLLGIGNYDIKGSGTINVAPSNFKIDNYSQRTIIFNGIDLGASTESGLIILGKNMSAFANKPQAVSGIEAYKYIVGITKQFDSLPQNGVHYIGSTSKSNGISVTNYYDVENPFLENPIIPDIVFFDEIKSHGIYDIKNTSGDIIFNIDSLLADKTNLEASQGNIYLSMDNASSKLTLKSGDKIFAGKDIEIKANSVDIKGKLSTGYSDRTLTITDAMLNDLIVDDTTGEKNLINLGNNNIKAVYKDNQIYLYNIGQTGESITITKKDGSDATGVIDGEINIATGHQKITIDNKTSKQLNISNIANDKIVEGLNADGVTLNSEVEYSGYDSAETTINSVGKLVLDGIINNAKNGDGTLNIVANNGLDINQLVYNINEDVLNSIDAAGNILIDVKKGELNIAGNILNKGNLNIVKDSDTSFTISSKINNKNGDVNINNKSYHKGLAFSGSIENQDGDVIISTFSGLTQTGTITNNNGLIKIINKKNGIAGINGNITNNKGDIVLETNGTDINADITAVDGSVSISNAIWKFTISDDSKIQAKTGISIYNGDINTNKLVINSDILNTGSGEISITNENANGIEILKNITNKGGNIAISNTGKTVVSKAVTSELGDITIDTNGIDINNAITADKGNILITSINNYNQKASVINNEGNTTITVINGTSTINGDIINANGNISISTDGESANITSNIETSYGSIDIENTEGNLTLANTSSVTATDGISITNTNDAQNLNIAGTVINTYTGDVTISSLNGLTISKDISNNSGNINISNNSGLAAISGAVTNNGNISISNNGTTAISKTVSTNNGNITINSNGLTVNDISTKKGAISITSTNGYSQSGDVINSDGNTSISSTNGANIIIGDITNTKGNIQITTNSASFNIVSDIKTSDGKIEIENKKGDLTISDAASVSATNGIKIKNTENAAALTIEGNVNNGNNNIEISSLKNLTISNDVSNETGNVIITNASGAMDISGNISNETGNISIANNSGLVTVSGDIANGNGNVTLTNNDNSIITGAIETLTGDVTLTSVGLTVGNISTDEGAILLTSTNGFSQSGNIVNGNGNTTITSENGANVLVGDISNTKGDISITTNGTETQIGADINTADGIVNIENKKGILNFTDTSKVSATNGVTIKNTENAGKLTTSGNISNTDGNITITSVNGAAIGGIVENANGRIMLDNSVNDNLQISAKIKNNNGQTLISNSSLNGGVDITTSGSIYNVNDKISISNNGSQGIDIKGIIKTDKNNIEISNQNSNILIGEFESANDNYVTAANGNIIINQTNGSIYNGTENEYAQPSYKTLLVSGGDLELNVTDGDIGKTYADDPGVSTKASTRIADESINVKISGNITAKAENQDKSDERLINLRAKESDLNLKNVVSDGNIILTAADMKQTGAPDSSGYAPYESYSVTNAGEEGDYVISGQNTSIVASHNIGEEGKNLTMIQDHLGNPDAKVYLEAFDSIYFDGKSNKPGEKVQIAQARTKGIGEIVLDVEDDTNVEQLVFGHTIKVVQKGQNLVINNISMYGEHMEDDESILPTSEDINDYGKQILMEAYDAYSPIGNSSITIKNADILGLGLRDENGNRIVDVKLVADNIVFESNAKSNLSAEPIVFEVAGVSPDNVASVGGTRSNYNYKDGRYLVNNALINVETDRANNTGLIFNKLHADNAALRTNMANVTVNDGYITNAALITNGNLYATSPNHQILVNNISKGLQPYDAQLYTAKTGPFYLILDSSNLIRTNAPVVHYSDDILVNGYNSENSFTRLTLKENVVQQVSKFVHEKVMPSDISNLKVQDVKLDTSNIIMDEIINFNLSNDKEEENKNLSLKD